MGENHLAQVQQEEEILELHSSMPVISFLLLERITEDRGTLFLSKFLLSG